MWLDKTPSLQYPVNENCKAGMFVEFGHYCLILAFMGAVLPYGMPYKFLRVPDSLQSQITGRLANLQMVCLGGAILDLGYAFGVSDFSVKSVAFHSNIDTPFLYKLTAVWGHHEGSMLLWCFLLSVFAAIFSMCTPSDAPYKKPALIIVNTILFLFLFYTLFASNPFERLMPFPVNSGELNPLLQDPAMAIHPPLLYMGYVGFAVPFSLSIISLLKPNVVPLKTIKTWIYVAWGFLTLGIIIGSFWAYYELGWGGWWFWDPVENASLLPWLCGVILLHVGALASTSPRHHRLFHLMNIFTFLSCVLGALLIRSGILTSVHTFAVDTSRGVFLSLIFMSLLIFSLCVWFKNGPSLSNDHPTPLLSRPRVLIFQALLFGYLGFIILFSLLYPLVQQYIFDTKISVGPDFYFQTMVCPFLIGALGMVFSLDLHRPFFKITTWMYGSIFIALFLTLAYLHKETLQDKWASCFGVALAITIMMASIMHLILYQKSANGHASMAHFCIGLILLGASGNALSTIDKLAVMQVGETITVKDQSLYLRAITPKPYKNYLSYQADFLLGESTVLTPERRLYYTPKIEHSESALSYQDWGLYYVVLGDTKDQKEWLVRAYYNPLIFLIWIGGILLSLSSLWYAYDKRRRLS